MNQTNIKLTAEYNARYLKKVQALEEQGLTTSDAQGVVDAEEMQDMKVINMNEKQIDDLAEEALNIACLTIQNAMNVKTGDLAGMFFSDNEVKQKFIEYIQSEINNKKDY